MPHALHKKCTQSRTGCLQVQENICVCTVRNVAHLVARDKVPAQACKPQASQALHTLSKTSCSPAAAV